MNALSDGHGRSGKNIYLIDNASSTYTVKGHIVSMPDGALLGHCNGTGHKGCKCWLSGSVVSGRQVESLIDLSKWLVSGFTTSQADHGDAAAKLRVSYGMKPRGAR